MIDSVIDFVCPFHRGDVLIGLQAACTAAMYGKKIRMHVSKDLMPWVQEFPYKEYINVESLDIGIPSAKDTPAFLQDAIKKVMGRKDFSGKIACSHPNVGVTLSDEGIDLVENMFFQIGMPPNTLLECIKPSLANKADVERVKKDCNIKSFKNTVLLQSNGGWSLKSMSDSTVKQIADVVHSRKLKLLQIGGESDSRSKFVDGYVLKNLSISVWRAIFEEALAIVSVDSWSAHFASMLNANQIVCYGGTRSKEPESKKHFRNQEGAYLRFDSTCLEAPCNSLECKFGYEHCPGMKIENEILDDFFVNIRKKKTVGIALKKKLSGEHANHDEKIKSFVLDELTCYLPIDMSKRKIKSVQWNKGLIVDNVSFGSLLHENVIEISDSDDGVNNIYTLSGWAVDIDRMQRLKEVYAFCNGKYLRCVYGIFRADVANAILCDSIFIGFVLNFPASFLLENGKIANSIVFYMITEDKHILDPVVYKLQSVL